LGKNDDFKLKMGVAEGQPMLIYSTLALKGLKAILFFKKPCITLNYL